MHSLIETLFFVILLVLIFIAIILLENILGKITKRVVMAKDATDLAKFKCRGIKKRMHLIKGIHFMLIAGLILLIFIFIAQYLSGMAIRLPRVVVLLAGVGSVILSRKVLKFYILLQKKCRECGIAE